MDVLDFSNMKGPFPAVSEVLKEYASQGSVGLMDSSTTSSSSSKRRSRNDTMESVDL